MKVLIVDDSKLARMALVKALRAVRPGWTHVEAANADEALALAKEAHPDVAILDFNMPGCDGIALASEVKARHPTIPLAVISANHQREIISRVEEVGGIFLFKPLKDSALDEFLTTAEKQLKSHP